MSEKIDDLERGEFIDFVKGLMKNSEQYKRDNESNSYVIAIDSAWGTGKSYFIDLLIQSIDDNDLKIVKYNAWKNDYCENAFEPLIYDILTSDCLSFSVENDNDKKNIIVSGNFWYSDCDGSCDYVLRTLKTNHFFIHNTASARMEERYNNDI